MQQSVYHVSVLTQEVLEYLNPQPHKIYVDATFGGGGHTRAILQKEPQCWVIAFDWDLVALEKNQATIEAEFPGRVKFIWGNFAQIIRLLEKEGIQQIDGLLADFGTSQHQIHERPGFSFAQDTPLDMRMSPGHQRTTAADILNKASEKELAEIFWVYGEERFSRQLARAIVYERSTTSFKTTNQLVALVQKIVPRKGRIHPATRTFQALRIVVNKELENISAFLDGALKVVRSEGRIVCISFHSLEDRLVKQFFKQHSMGPTAQLKNLTKKVVVASDEEADLNPSSRSARLRAAQIL
ncbi:MAG: 16S rRNA (cytosine(1402)-N(4))-methyltransferase RsmH [Candidatus Babeliales bacterium]